MYNRIKHLLSLKLLFWVGLFLLLIGTLFTGDLAVAAGKVFSLFLGYLYCVCAYIQIDSFVCIVTAFVTHKDINELLYKRWYGDGQKTEKASGSDVTCFTEIHLHYVNICANSDDEVFGILPTLVKESISTNGHIPASSRLRVDYLKYKDNASWDVGATVIMKWTVHVESTDREEAMQEAQSLIHSWLSVNATLQG